MSKAGYIKSNPFDDFARWAEREFEAIERALESVTTESSTYTVTNNFYEVTNGAQTYTQVIDSASPVNVVLPTDFDLDAVLKFYQKGAGTVVLVTGDGATIHSRPGVKSAGQYAVFYAWKQSATEWVLSGDLIENTDQIIVPQTGGLTLTGHAPTINLAQGAPLSAGSLVLTGHAPTVFNEGYAFPSAGTLTITGHAPTVVNNGWIYPDAGSLTLTGQVPVVSNDGWIYPSAGALTITGQTPTVVNA